MYTLHPMVKSEYDRVWRKYCGFLDLTLPQFMSIQESLLLQQLERFGSCSLGRRLIGTRVPRSVDEYRQLVPLTTYEDYLPELEAGDEEALPEKTHVWASTSGASGGRRCVPFTREAYDRTLDGLMSALILACSRQRGRSTLAEGDRVLYNVAPTPYLSGVLANGASRMFNLRPIMTPDMHDGMDFKEKVSRGFELSLRSGMDILVAMTSVLVKTGNEFNRMSGSRTRKFSSHLRHPAEMSRILRAFLRSRIENRKMLPKDLWPLKALIGWGIDTGIYRDLVYTYWGAYPYEMHACTEAGIMALQSWTRRGLTFIPHSNFYEFIPEAEWHKCTTDVFHEPRTVLYSDVRAGERYELVVTSFYGMPFIRYRLGHLIRITAMEDKEAQVYLPQMVFESRADDLLDIAGFTRVSEKTVMQAIANTGIEYDDWTIRKETADGKPALHLYIELCGNSQPIDLAAVLHRNLIETDPGYHDLACMMEIKPLKVTVLRQGAFDSYYRNKQDNGVELAKSRPPRINASDTVITELLGTEGRQTVAVA